MRNWLSRVDPKLIEMGDRYRRAAWFMFWIELAVGVVLCLTVIEEMEKYLFLGSGPLHVGSLNFLTQEVERALEGLEAGGASFLEWYPPDGFERDYFGQVVDLHRWALTEELARLRTLTPDLEVLPYGREHVLDEVARQWLWFRLGVRTLTLAVVAKLFLVWVRYRWVDPAKGDPPG